MVAQAVGRALYIMALNGKIFISQVLSYTISLPLPNSLPLNSVLLRKSSNKNNQAIIIVHKRMLRVWPLCILLRCNNKSNHSHESFE